MGERERERGHGHGPPPLGDDATGLWVCDGTTTKPKYFNFVELMVKRKHRELRKKKRKRMITMKRGTIHWPQTCLSQLLHSNSVDTHTPKINNRRIK